MSASFALLAASVLTSATHAEPVRRTVPPKVRPALPPEGLGDLQTVCGKCHTLAIVVERRRTRADWVRVMEKMQNLGLPGTEAQIDGAIRYIQRNLMEPTP